MQAFQYKFHDQGLQSRIGYQICAVFPGHSGQTVYLFQLFDIGCLVLVIANFQGTPTAEPVNNLSVVVERIIVFIFGLVRIREMAIKDRFGGTAD